MKLQPEFWLGQTVKVIRPDDDDDYYDHYVDYSSVGTIGRNYRIKGIHYNACVPNDRYSEDIPFYSYLLEGSNFHKVQVLTLVDASTPYPRVPFFKPIVARNQRNPVSIECGYVGSCGKVKFKSGNNTVDFNDLIFNTTPIL